MSTPPDPSEQTTRLLGVADELYALPLGDFTPERDRRVKQLRGDPVAPRVKALRKPTTAAWVVNLLVRRDHQQVDQLLTVGTALREAQQAMSPGELRTLTRQRRQVTAAVTTQARRLALAEGLRVTEAVAAAVEGTLTAAMLDAECGRAVASGLLVAPLHTTGVTALTPEDVADAIALPEALGAVATPREAPAPEGLRATLHVVPDPDAARKRREAAQSRLQDAEEAHARAAQAADEARARTAEVEARTLQVQAEIDELRRRLADLEEQAEESEEEHAEAEEVLDAANVELRTATAELEAARGALARLAD